MSIYSLPMVSCEDEPVEIGIEHSDTPKNVGDIYFDPKLDDIQFQICNEDNILQYYNFYESLNYEGEKYALDEQIYAQFKERKRVKNESGYITIRFIVNCHGETGRFRTTQMDQNYELKKFDKSIVEQLESITKSLQGWLPGKGEDTNLDYYQYITYKIDSGKITDILP
ncbi:MAG: hypothetical protein MK105_05380 [Crocinitomicaceae bacterium]|nr:hypothetical protein [Crocinitomicaceae bacterium]